MRQFLPVQRMNDTGIGLAGIDGVWWLPAQTPFSLQPTVADALNAFGCAVFALFDCVTTLFQQETDERIGELLRYKVPESLQEFVGNGRVLSVRPDFQLQQMNNGRLQPVVTELEICPSAHGFA
ncbi:MAG: hypothetical protein KC421_17005, partial [Anaerolineales bacterium]|nr:hypothetical protein [Anaerolineales bacterium]